MTPTPTPAFGPLVSCCAAHGISRSVAFELARKGLLETFLLNSRRYVLLESLRNLPETLRQRSDTPDRKF